MKEIAPLPAMFELTNPLDRLDWALIFPTPAPVILDLGAGDGGFALDYAQQRPEVNILAVERLLGRARKISKRSTRLGLANLRVLRLESAYLLHHLIPEATVAEIHLLFPDPWPKIRHRHNRLIQPPFLAQVRQALQPGGLFRFVTDHQEYFESSASLIKSLSGGGLVDLRETYPRTDFEKEYVTEGRTISSLEWRKSDS